MRTEEMTQDGAALIAAERQRQIDAEGYSPQHDAVHSNAALAWAAACYAAPEPVYRVRDEATGRDGMSRVVQWWEPWPHGWRRPECDRIRELVKAGALIAAEIDRLSEGN